MVKREFTIKVNSEELDQTIEKANRLVELLREAQQIIDSLSYKKPKYSKQDAFITALNQIANRD